MNAIETGNKERQLQGVGTFCEDEEEHELIKNWLVANQVTSKRKGTSMRLQGPLLNGEMRMIYGGWWPEVQDLAKSRPD
jgi:hypothetical protein